MTNDQLERLDYAIKTFLDDRAYYQGEFADALRKALFYEKENVRDITDEEQLTKSLKVQAILAALIERYTEKKIPKGILLLKKVIKEEMEG